MTDAACPFSSRARVVLAIGRGIASAMGHPESTSTHVALGLLREGENAAVAVLVHANIPLHDLRRKLELQLEPRGHPRPREAVLPLTRSEVALVEQADVESRLRADEYLGPEHLLLAICRDYESPAALALRSHGLTYEHAATLVESLVHRH